MSQVVTLADLPISPIELDEKERLFEQEGQWVEWVRFTREIVQGLEERVRFAMWARLAKKFEKFSADLDQKQASLASDLCVLSAKIWQQEVDRQDLAMSLFTKAYRFDPDNMEALRGTRLISEKLGNWKLALQLCTYEQELLREDKDKATLFLHMAEICSKHLNLNDDAVRCVKEATKLIPGFQPAVHYEQMIDDVEGRQRQQYEEYLAEAEKSKTPRQKARCFRDAAEVLIGIDPQSEEIETLLQKSIELEPRNESARLSLQTFYQLNERWEALAAFLIERLASTQRRQDRLNILKDLAKLSEKALNDHDSSIKWHREVLSLDPVDELSINFCTEYYHQHQSWRELVQVYESALKMRRRNQDEGEMLFQIAMILWRKIIDYVEAEKYFKRIKLNDPRHPLMLKFYVDFYTQQEDWRRLLTVLSTQQSEAEEIEDKIVIGFRMAQVAEENLKSNDKAIEMWRAILRLDPSRAEAIESLTRLYELGNKWSALLELLKEQFEYLADDEITAKIGHLEQMIEIYQSRMRQPVMVMNTYRQILEIDPRYEPALSALESLYQDSSRWNELAEMIERQAELLDERGEQEALRTRYKDLAKLNEKHLGNLDQAVYYYEEMLSISNELDAIEPLVRLYSGMKDWTSLFETYKRQLELDMEEGERVSLLVIAAKVADEQLSFYQESIELWRIVLELNENHDEAWNALSDLYQKVQQWRELSALYAAKIEQLNTSHTTGFEAKAESEYEQTEEETIASVDVSEALPWLKKRADLLSEQMNNDESAAEMWWRVLEAEPHDLQAESFLRSFYTESFNLEAIDRLYRTRSDFEGYLSYLDQLLLGSHEETLERNILFRRGQVAFNDLQDEITATQSWEKALELVPNDEDSAIALIPLYRDKEQWTELVSVLTVRYQRLLKRLEQDAGEQDQFSDDWELEFLALEEVSTELIEVNELKLGAINDAFSIALSTFSVRPTQISSLEVVARLAPHTEPRLDHQLVERIEELLNSSTLLQEPEYIEAKSSLLWQLASTCADPLQEYTKAVAYYWEYRESASDVEKGDQALKPLAELYEELEDWTELLKVLAMIMERTEVQEETERLLAQIGVIHEQFTQDFEQAESHYLDLLDLNANSRSAIRGLQRIASERGDQAQLFEYLDAELAICKSSEDFANLKFRLGEIALEREGAEAALTHFSAALSHFPGHNESAKVLVQLLDEELYVAYPAAVLLESIARENTDATLLVRVLEYILEGFVAELSLDCLYETSRLGTADSSETGVEDSSETGVEDSLETGVEDSLETGVEDSSETGGEDSSETGVEDSSETGVEDSSETGVEDSSETGVEDSSETGVEDSSETGVEDSSETPKHFAVERDQSALLAELALLIENDLTELERAFEINIKRLEVKPEDETILADLYRLAEQTEQWVSLTEVLNDFSYVGSKEVEDNIRYTLSRSLAEIVESKLHDQQQAREVWQQISEAEGDTLEVLDQISRLAESLEDWAQLIEMLDRSLTLVEADIKLERLHKLATLWYECLENQDEAIEVYQKILVMNSNDQRAESSLENLLKESQRYHELSEFYQSRLALCVAQLTSDEMLKVDEVSTEEMEATEGSNENQDGDQASEQVTQSQESIQAKITYLRYQLAYILNTHLREPLDALSFAADNISIQDKIDQATVTLVEQMLVSYCDGSDESLEVRALGCDLLDEVYAHLGQWQLRISLLEKRIEDSSDASEKASHYLSISRYYEHEGSLFAEAYTSIQHGIRQGYSLHNLCDELERLSQELGAWDETGSFLYKQLTEQLDAEDTDRLAMVQRVARIFEQELGDQHTAITVFEFGRQEAPDELIILRELNRLYELTGQAEALVQILELRIELEAEIEASEIEIEASEIEIEASEIEIEASEIEGEVSEIEGEASEIEGEISEIEGEASEPVEQIMSNSYELQRELSYQLGAILNEQLGQTQRAIEVYQRVRADFVPGDTQSYEALSILFTQLNDMHGLVDLYREQVEFISDIEQKELLLSMAAEVSLAQLGQAEDAIELYESILEFNPSSEASLISLAEIYSSLQRYEDHIEVLSKRADLYEEHQQSAQYDLQRALIHRDQLVDPVATIEILQEIFVKSPETSGLVEAFESLLSTFEVRLEATKVLAPIYRENEQWSEYASVLLSTLEDRLDVGEKVSVYRDVADVQRNKLESLSGAFDSLVAAYELEPDLSELETELEELAAWTGRDSELIECYEKAVLDVPDREITLRIKVAELAEQRLGDLEKAIASYQEILMQEPEHLEVMSALEKLLAVSERYQDLAELYNQKLDVIEDETLRSETYGQLASVYEAHLSMPMESIEVWRRQLEDNERHELAFSELERLLTFTESFDELAALYEEWIASSPNAVESIAVKSRLATLTINVLNDGISFVDHIREIFEVDALHQESIDSLSILFANEERCQVTGADRNAIAELLQPIARGLTVEVITEREVYSADQESSEEDGGAQSSVEISPVVSTRTLDANPQLLIHVLDVLQQNEMDPEVRAQQLLELAKLQEEIANDLSAAFDARLTALRFNATELDNRHALQRLALSTHRYQDLASGLEQAANEALEIEDKSSLLLELGKVYESYLDDFEKAGYFYQEILNDDPQHQGAVTALETLYARLSQYQSLIDLYLRLADESENDEQRIRRLFQACEMMRHLDAHDQLIETYRNVLEIDEQNLVAYRELERLFQITEEWGALANLLQERIERIELDESIESDAASDDESDQAQVTTASIAYETQKPESRSELRCRLAKLLEQLNDYDEAIETWRAILDEDDSRFEPAFEALDQMASSWRSLGVDEPRRQTISEILTPLYFEQGQWEAWIRSTEDMLDFIFDPEERTEHFKALAQVAENELSDLKRALDYTALAFQALPDQTELELEVDRLVEATESWIRAIEIFESVVAQVFDPEEGTRIWLKIAKLYESKLNDDDRAQAAYIKARELSPDSTQAITALREFYTTRESYRALVDLLKDVAPLLEEEADRIEALSSAGSILTQTLQQAQEAIEVYSMLRQEAPDALEPLLALEKLYRQAEDWPAVIDSLNEQIELQEDEALKIVHLHAIATVYGESLQNPDEQIASLRQILEIQATEAQSLNTLKQLFTAREDWNDLSILLEDERSHYDDASLEAILLDVQQAHLNRQHTQQFFTAVELYGEVLKRREALETHAQPEVIIEVVDGLAQMIHIDEVRADSAELLIAYFEQAEQSEALKSTYETLVALETDPVERSGLYIKLGQLLRDKLNLPQEAFFAYAQALRDDLQNEELLSTLQVIGGEQSMYAEMVQTYAEIAALDPLSELGATLSRLRAKLCENRLQDIAQATEAWEQSLSVDPDHLETLKALSGLYNQQERWSDLISILETRVELEADEYELRVLLGELMVRVHGDARRAIEQWKIVLMDFPQAESAQRMLETYLSDPEFVNDISLVLEPIYEEQERWEAWVKMNRALLEVTSVDDSVRREELWTELGQLYADRLDDELNALNAYSEAFLINPVELEIREKLFALVEKKEAWVTFLPKLLQSTSIVSDPELLVADYLKIASWSETYLNDSDQAVSAYQNALRVDGECHQATKALERIFTQRSDWGSLADVQQRQIEVTYDEEKRVELLKAYAQNVWHNLGQVDKAQNIYEELININDQELSSYQALEQLLSDLGKQAELMNLLERKLEAVDLDGAEQSKLQKQFISIAETSGDYYRATEVARQAYEAHPSDQEIKTSLHRLLMNQENWDDLRELLDQDLDNAQGQERLRLAQELAVLCEEKLSLVDDAIDYLLKALEVSPADRVVFAKAQQLMTQVMRYDDLLDLIESHLEANKDLSNDERLNLNIELAQRSQEEGMQERSVEALERVLAIDSNHPVALSTLAKAYEEEGDWSKATDMLQRALEYSEAGVVKAEALTRLGLIYMDQLNDDAKAKQAFESAINEAPTAQALDALVMFARDEENESRVGELLEMKLPIVEGRERLSVYRELASYYQRSGRDQDQLILLEQAYQEAPEATKLTEMLVERYLNDQRFTEVEPMIRTMMNTLEAAGKSKALNRYTYQLGKLKQAQGEQDVAFELFERCRASDPTFAPALVALSQIYVNAERWDDAQALLSPLLIQRQLSKSDKVEVFYLNGVTRQALGDERKAKDMFQRALSLNPEHTASQEGLTRLS